MYTHSLLGRCVSCMSSLASCTFSSCFFLCTLCVASLEMQRTGSAVGIISCRLQSKGWALRGTIASLV